MRKLDIPSFLGGCATIAALLNHSAIETFAGTMLRKIHLLDKMPLAQSTSTFAACTLAATSVWAIVSSNSSNTRKFSLAPLSGHKDFREEQANKIPFLETSDFSDQPSTFLEYFGENMNFPPSSLKNDIHYALAKQLTPFTRISEEPPHRAAVMALLCLSIKSGTMFEDERNTLAGAFAKGVSESNCEKICLGLVQRCLSACLDTSVNKDIADDLSCMALATCAKRHAFSETMTMGLLVLARKKMVIGSAEFGWLLRVDRPLYFALNTVGRPSHLPEAIGAACQFEFENRNWESFNGLPPRQLRLDAAVAGIIRRGELYAEDYRAGTAISESPDPNDL